MSVFRIVPRIQSFSRLADFMEAFSVGKGDVILTDRFLYEKYFASSDFRCVVQDDYGKGEPDSVRINRIREDIIKTPYERVIAVGGGSVIDISKLMALDGWTDCLPLFKKEIPSKKTKKLVIVPTTCGTGSEVTNISIAAFPELNTKFGLADDALYADDAVLVAELIEGLPYRVFMHSSIDALIHAIESYLSPKANELTEMFSVKAMEMIIGGYIRMVENGKEEMNAMAGTFLAASNYAGIAFSNAGCGLIHAMSYPIGNEYHIPHGESNYELMEAVLDFYSSRQPGGKFASMCGIIAGIIGCPAERAVSSLCHIIDSLIARKAMAEFGMDTAKSAAYAGQVIDQQQRLLANAYVPITRADIEKIYNNIL